MHDARAWLLLLFLGTALAGCVEDTPQPAADGLDGIDADVGGDLPALVPSLTAEVSNGTAPLLVNLTLDAEGADDNTTWSVDFGDGNATDGVGLPASLNHTFGVGNHTVSALAARGNDTAVTNLTITVLAGGPASGTLLRTDPYHVEGTMLASVEAPGCGDFPNTVNEHPLEFLGDGLGGVVVGRISMTMDLDDSNLDSDTELYDPDGNMVADSGSFNVLAGPESFEVTGAFPVGTYTLKVIGCTGVDMGYRIDGQVDYVAA